MLVICAIDLLGVIRDLGTSFEGTFLFLALRLYAAEHDNYRRATFGDGTACG